VRDAAGLGRRRPALSSRPMSRVLDLTKRTIRAVRIAATDTRIPRPLRWLAALGLAPIPGPFDEALLLIVAIPLALFYRRPLRDAWRRADAAAS
jgi:hypothetical protein